MLTSELSRSGSAALLAAIFLSLTASGFAGGCSPDSDEPSSSERGAGGDGSPAGGGPSSGGNPIETGGMGGGAQVDGACDPEDLTGHWDAHGGTDCEIGTRCELELPCTSQTSRTFVFVCEEYDEETNRWSLEGKNCFFPAESCSALDYEDYLGAIECVDSTWRWEELDPELEARSLCPLAPRTVGASCSAGEDFGADAQACGYPCGDDGWTVVGCHGDYQGTWTEGTWTEVEACAPR